MKRAILIALALALLVSLALPVTAMAKTKWDLEGWRLDANKWMDGLLFTYYEDDNVQYRLKATNLEGTEPLTITIRHDYQDADGAFGVDSVGDFFVGEQTPRGTGPDVAPIPAADAFYTVSAMRYVPVPNGVELQFDFIVPDAAALIAAVGGDDFAFYWKAHLAVTAPSPPPYGSSYWNGASLHAHTSVTGSQDVPIKTPPKTGPPPEPGIEIIKYVSVDGQVTWLDANSEYAECGTYTQIYFKIVVTNTGNVDLTGIELTDVWENEGVWSQPIDLSGLYPDSLAVGESFEIIVGPLTAGYCWHINTASVSCDQNVSGSDVAKYHGE